MSTDVEVLTAKVKDKARKLKWWMGLGGVLLAGPLTWMLAYAILGATALGASLAIAAVVALAIINFAPLVAMKFENARIKAIIAEAEKNPIPTLWAGHEQDAKDLVEMAKAIEDYATEIGNVQSKAQKLTADLKPDDVAAFARDIQLMQHDLELQEQDYANALKAHQMQEVEIRRASAIWNLNMAVARANAKNMNRAQETMARIKRETALDAVTSSMNRSKAQLRARILARTSSDLARGDEASASRKTVEAIGVVEGPAFALPAPDKSVESLGSSAAFASADSVAEAEPVKVLR